MDSHQKTARTGRENLQTCKGYFAKIRTVLQEDKLAVTTGSPQRSVASLSCLRPRPVWATQGV